MLNEQITRAIQKNFPGTANAALRKHMRDIVGSSCNEAAAYRVENMGRLFELTVYTGEFLRNVAAVVRTHGAKAPQRYCGCAHCDVKGGR